MKVKNCKIITLPERATPDGCKIAFGESKAHIPFEIKRFYSIYNFEREGIKRGGHAHRTFEQVFFAINGSFLFLLDDGTIQERVNVNNPQMGVFVGPAVWHEMVDIVKGSIIFVVASHVYNESDYIRNYQQFLEYVKK